ncbi:PIG-L family deacetylase [Denitrificimonas sp. JX-1]|uniref:PIG-L family deacetylase n=1 Tax=Denitrificimonas halotolerans TaxID=3098930 RepID=A0ABU5GTH4_9GAMM|nr:PIG-L family deacetylase [Denitrificimonas sp. JX-1]MDY7220169.1 PIG-L family deacetylase [Denitrificimonas sp. JX-1]
MSVRKQQLLKQHRRNKRLAIFIILLGLLVLGLTMPLWVVPLALLILWAAHEAWFADHLFYSPTDDYQYRFPKNTRRLQLTAVNKRWQVTTEQLSTGATVIAKVSLKSSWLGRWFDPVVRIGDDSQTFERGAQGVRYLNLTGQAEALMTEGLPVQGRFCHLDPVVELYIFEQTSPVNENIMILAPHADDAELAAFGLYSSADNVSIVTLTQGEIEAEYYQRLGLSQQQAALLKGRLRTWDSLAIPLWGGVPQTNCVQLGYYCMQLSEMAKQPSVPFASKESGETDTRRVRQYNSLKLAGDVTGQPTWQNLVADLVGCLQHFKPDVVVMPHPDIDPHADHIATTQALYQALEQSTWQPKRLFLYANHLHDNDRWPMGVANTGVALPPAMVELPADELFSYVLNEQQQLDKAMALLMQHDLQPPLPLKKRIRRHIQALFTGRRWPKTGENEFLRKAVRRHEVFWVRQL